jgi:uncharacterized membrane protein YidH (DUF202 family)
MHTFLKYLTPSLLVAPLMVQAQFGDIDTFFKDTAAFINDILIPILLAVAFLIFIIGVIRFFFAADSDNSDSRKEGRQLMIWGILAFVAIVCIWGITALIAGGLGLDDDTLDVRPVTPFGA